MLFRRGLWVGSWFMSSVEYKESWLVTGELGAGGYLNCKGGGLTSTPDRGLDGLDNRRGAPFLLLLVVQDVELAAARMQRRLNHHVGFGVQRRLQLHRACIDVLVPVLYLNLLLLALLLWV